MKKVKEIERNWTVIRKKTKRTINDLLHDAHPQKNKTFKNYCCRFCLKNIYEVKKVKKIRLK